MAKNIFRKEKKIKKIKKGIKPTFLYHKNCSTKFFREKGDDARQKFESIQRYGELWKYKKIERYCFLIFI